MSLYNRNVTIGDLVTTPAVVNELSFPVFYSGSTYRVTLADIKASITKVTLGLGNVDNTSDVNKPVSVAVATALLGKSDIVHSHTIQQVTGLNAALAEKALVLHTHNTSEVTGLDSAIAGKADLNHVHGVAEITGLTNALAAKADTTAVTALVNAKANISHTHNASDIIGLPAIPADLATQSFVTAAIAAEPVHSHSHDTTQITGLSAQLTTKADVSVVNQQIATVNTALGTKSAIGHSHGIADVTELSNTLTSLESRLQTNFTTADSVIRSTATADKTELTALISVKADANHTHNASNITGLPALLAAKADTGHLHNIADVSNLRSELDARLPITTFNSQVTDINDTITALQTQVNGMGGGLGGNIEINNVNNLLPTLNQHQAWILNRSIVGHTHAIAEVVGLPGEIQRLSDNTDYAVTEIDNIKTNGLITPISKVTGLQAALNDRVMVSDYDTRNTTVNTTLSSLQTQVLNRAVLNHTHDIDHIYNLSNVIQALNDDIALLQGQTVDEQRLLLIESRATDQAATVQAIADNIVTINSAISALSGSKVIRGVSSYDSVQKILYVEYTDDTTVGLSMVDLIAAIPDTTPLASTTTAGKVKFAVAAYDQSCNALEPDSAITPAGLAAVAAELKVRLDAPYEIDFGLASVQPDMATFRNFTWQLTATRALMNPVSKIVGRSGSFFVKQAGSGGNTIGFGTMYKAAGGIASLPALSTAVGAVDRIDYLVASDTEIHIRIVKDIKA